VGCWPPEAAAHGLSALVRCLPHHRFRLHDGDADGVSRVRKKGFEEFELQSRRRSLLALAA
jgi:hypothetical protein